MELLGMINGKTVPTSAVIQGHAKELGSDVGYLQKVAAETSVCVRATSFCGGVLPGSRADGTAGLDAED
jgi:hypothetical protein